MTDEELANAFPWDESSLNTPSASESTTAKVNWTHPGDMFFNWSEDALERCLESADEACQDNSRVMPPQLLWIHPSINGLANPPAEFRVRITWPSSSNRANISSGAV